MNYHSNMRYQGSKRRICKDILPFVLKDRKKGQYYVEPFCGGCNSISNVDGNRIASDINPYLIAMLKKAISGWCPNSFYNKKTFELFRNLAKIGYDGNLNYLVGYIGFSCSYNSIFFDKYVHSSYIKRDDVTRDFQIEFKKSFMKTINLLQGVEFHCCSYDELDIPKKSVIYCDPPYKDTKKYDKINFDYDKFYQWCFDKKSEGHRVYISEYWMPNDFNCIWEKEVPIHINSYKGENRKIERLFII